MNSSKNLIRTGITVLICCYNSANRLASTLLHLAAQRIESGTAWEVIIVDNASTDNTSLVSVNIWKQLGRPVKLSIINEPTAGKSYALKKGLDAAKYSLVIICDDDNWLASNYLQEAMNIMCSNAAIGILGGQSEAVSDIQLPDWFDSVKHHYACGAPRQYSSNLTGDCFIWGAGMVIRTKLMEEIFNVNQPLLLACRKGEQLISGGDDEICVRAWLLGAETHFDTRLYFQHYMPANRLTKEYYARLLQGFSHQFKIINAYKRLYEITKMTPIKKKLFILINLARLAKCKLFPSSIREISAKDYFYFLTCGLFFYNENNKKILDFYQTIRQLK